MVVLKPHCKFLTRLAWPGGSCVPFLESGQPEGRVNPGCGKSKAGWLWKLVMRHEALAWGSGALKLAKNPPTMTTPKVANVGKVSGRNHETRQGERERERHPEACLTDMRDLNPGLPV